jgi:hypothetical protein
MKLLASKKMSLICFVLNCIFAFAAYLASDALWFLFSVSLAALCFYNYQNALDD